jgi:hypothetical protein
LRTVCLIQAAYFLLTGIWPLVHIRSFMKVTGPKQDIWLVKTVGILVTVIGATLAVAARRDEITPATMGLAIGSAAALGLVDVMYVGKGVIARIYLLDAAAEAVLMIAWLSLSLG